MPVQGGGMEIKMKEFELKIGELTDDERRIILAGCLINFYKEQ